MKLKELQDFIRSNGFSWPGGYPMALLMNDGECIDAQAARENYRRIRRATEWDWIAEAVFVHWEGEPIQCAYGVPGS